MYSNQSTSVVSESAAMDFLKLLNRFNVKYVIPVIVLCGIISNLVALAVFVFSPLRRVTMSVYLAALSMTDVIFLVFLGFGWLESIQVPILHVTGLCQIMVYLTFVLSFLSVWFIVIFTLELYFSVYHTTVHRLISKPRRAVGITIFVTVIACLIFLFTFWLTRNESQGNDNTSTTTCRFNGGRLASIAVPVIDSIITLVIPFSLLFFVYVRLVYTIASMSSNALKSGVKHRLNCGRHADNITSSKQPANLLQKAIRLGTRIRLRLDRSQTSRDDIIENEDVGENEYDEQNAKDKTSDSSSRCRRISLEGGDKLFLSVSDKDIVINNSSGEPLSIAKVVVETAHVDITVQRSASNPGCRRVMCQRQSDRRRQSCTETNNARTNTAAHISRRNSEILMGLLERRSRERIRRKSMSGDVTDTIKSIRKGPARSSERQALIVRYSDSDFIRKRGSSIPGCIDENLITECDQDVNLNLNNIAEVNRRCKETSFMRNIGESFGSKKSLNERRNSLNGGEMLVIFNRPSVSNRNRQDNNCRCPGMRTKMDRNDNENVITTEWLGTVDEHEEEPSQGENPEENDKHQYRSDVSNIDGDSFPHNSSSSLSYATKKQKLYSSKSSPAKQVLPFKRLKKRCLKMMITLAVIFIVLNLPIHVIRIQSMIRSLYDSAYHISELELHLQFFFQTIYYLNFVANFLIYSACSKTFRGAVLNLPCHIATSFKHAFCLLRGACCVKRRIETQAVMSHWARKQQIRHTNEHSRLVELCIPEMKLSQIPSFDSGYKYVSPPCLIKIEKAISSGNN